MKTEKTLTDIVWERFEEENDGLLQRWCDETDPDRKAKLWNEIIELWGDWKEMQT